MTIPPEASWRRSRQRWQASSRVLSCKNLPASFDHITTLLSRGADRLAALTASASLARTSQQRRCAFTLDNDRRRVRQTLHRRVHPARRSSPPPHRRRDRRLPTAALPPDVPVPAGGKAMAAPFAVFFTGKSFPIPSSIFTQADATHWVSLPRRRRCCRRPPEAVGCGGSTAALHHIASCSPPHCGSLRSRR